MALASGKLLRPDGLTIDSAGIVMSRNRRPRDRGSDTPDRGLYDRTERVFAVSGAAIMIRSEAVSDISVDGELFDEDFLAYHEGHRSCLACGSAGMVRTICPSGASAPRSGMAARQADVGFPPGPPALLQEPLPPDHQERASGRLPAEPACAPPVGVAAARLRGPARSGCVTCVRPGVSKCAKRVAETSANP